MVRKLLVPEYIKKFKCIANECEDSCCSGWNVFIDKETYFKYKNSRDEYLKPLFEKQIELLDKQKSEAKFGSIKMNGTRCPFLNEKLLCSIQLKLGEDYLSNTCKQYPRVTNIVNGQLEQSAVTSCPEVARLVLLNPKPMNFEEVEIDSGSIGYISNFIEFNKGDINKYFWEFRILTLSVIQDRNYTIGERLIILGMIYQELNGLIKSNKPINYESAIEEFQIIIKNGNLKKELSGIISNIELQINVVKEMIDLRLSNRVFDKRFLECINEAAIGLGYRDKGNLSNIYEKYVSSLKECFTPFITEYEYIFENFLVNQVFTEMMPFGKYKNILESYVTLIVYYSIIRFILIGMAAYHGYLNEDLVLKLIQSFSKVILHNNTFIEQVKDIIMRKDDNSLIEMSILINDKV